MENLLESNLLRHFRIVRFLLYRGWVTIGELSEKLNIPPSTVRQNIGEINRYIYPAKIEGSQQFGIRLTYMPQLNSVYIYSSIFKQSLRFLIIEEFFVHEYATLDALAEKLFISQSTLKRKITAINQILKKYDFWLDTKKMDIIGDEKKICFFYYCYLIEKYGVFDLLVPDLELRLIDELILEFVSQHPKMLTPKRNIYSYLNKIRLMLFINLKRIKRGHLLNSRDQADERLSFLFSENLGKKIAAYYKIDCTEKVLYRLFYLFFNRRYAQTIDQLQIKITQDPCMKKVYCALLNFLDAIENNEQMTIYNKDKILLYLYNATSYIWGPTKILHNPNEEFFTNLNNYYEGFTYRVKKELANCLTKEKLDIYLDDSVINQLLFMFITSWEGLIQQLENKAPRVKAGIFFNTSYEHSQFLLNDISYHLKSRLDIELITVKTLAELRNLCPNFDMIITNLSTLELPECHIVSIQANPTARDFEKILTIYNEIVNKKTSDQGNLDTLKKANSIYKY